MVEADRARFFWSLLLAFSSGGIKISQLPGSTRMHPRRLPLKQHATGLSEASLSENGVIVDD